MRIQNDIGRVRKDPATRQKMMAQDLPHQEIDRLNRENRLLNVELHMLKARNDQADKQTYIPNIPLPEGQASRIREL